MTHFFFPPRLSLPLSFPRSRRTPPSRHRGLRRTAGIGVALGLLLGATQARAQQTTFHLDRLEMPGAPDDGVVLFRPTTNPRAIFFAQLGLGYQLHPLHTSNLTNDRVTLNASNTAVIEDQFTQYSTVGLELGDRITAAATLPIAWIQDGNQPNYNTGFLATAKRTSFSTGGPSVADMRLDLRGVLVRSLDRRFALGAQLSVFAPTGNGSVANFGGDGQTTAMLMATAEYTWRFITFVANTGIHFRPDASINDPTHDNGLGVGNEWRWAVGAFVPLKDAKGFERYRVGGTIFGQTGIQSTDTTGDTFFTKRNTPIEWNGEFRMKFGPKDNWWWGGSVGSLLGNGYGAPDLRIVGLVGFYVPILDSDASSPDRKSALREKWRSQHVGDADNDGIPDDIDACPTEPEDHKGNDPSDGCPLPPDRDGDGIPDQYDRCPDVPEDKDGIDDGDGCPEDDADQDGIPDVQDACPKEPGAKSSDPKRNGCPTLITVQGKDVLLMEPVHFATASTTILPDSFKMLEEIANYLKVNSQVKRMSIEGHTDNRGAAEMNMTLSQGRAASVRAWLIQHGIDANRLESHGYGMTRPIESNDTDKGRQANRRVEFHITETSDTNKIDKSNKSSPEPEPKKDEPRDEGDL